MFLKSKQLNPPVLFTALLAAVGLCICISNYGLGLSNDSVAYMAAAKTFYAECRFFIPYRDAYFTDWPPLFSILLSPAYFLKVDNKLFFFGVQVVAIYLLVVYVFGQLAYQLTSSTIWSVVAVVFFVSSPPTFLTFSYLWSETYFILFTMMFLITVSKYIEFKSWKLLCLCSLLAGLSVMMRYGGIVNIATGATLLLLYQNERFIFRLKRTLVFCLISCAPLIFWFVRNYSISSTLTGAGRTVEISHFKYTLVMLAKSMWLWFLPYPAVTFAGIFTIFFYGLVLLGLAYYIISKFRRNHKEKVVLLILGLSTLFYLTLILVTALLQASDFPDSRLTSPAFFSFLLIIVSLANTLWHKKKRIICFCLLIAGMSVGAFNLFRYYSYLKQSIEIGVEGHTDLNSRDSKVISVLNQTEWLRTYTDRKLVFTNHPEKLYYHGIQGIQRINKGFGNELSNNFKIKSNTKIIVWIGKRVDMENFIRDSAQDYFINSQQQYDDGIIAFLKLKDQSLPTRGGEAF